MPLFVNLYPDLWRPRLGYLLADAALVAWIAAWLYIGDAVYRAVMTLSVIAAGVISTGRHLNAAISQIQQGVDNLPIIGSGLRDALAPLHDIPGGLIAQGQQELVAIQHLALVLGVVAAGVPLLAALLYYIPWRIRKTRGFRNLGRMLRQPGANAATTTMHVLAARALYTLPYDHLLQYSRDPIGDWRDGRFYDLAHATMAREGLDLRRYLRRVEHAHPALPAHTVPTHGDEPHEDLHEGR